MIGNCFGGGGGGWRKWVGRSQELSPILGGNRLPDQESRLREGETGIGRGEGRPSPLPIPAPGADSGHTSAEAKVADLKARERGTASTGCVRPLAGCVQIDDRLVVLDRSLRRGRRRPLGPVPQLQMPQDLFNDRALADQADDFQRSGAAGHVPAIMRHLIFFVVV